MAVILLFLALSLLFYVLFGGADFGAGMLELRLGKTLRDEQQELMAHAVAPVWEANHMWLVLAVVILFMGFPRIYTELSTYLFLPIMAILLGIVVRGCAFTFRHYDTLTPRPQGLYRWAYRLSSLWTAFFLGVIAGAPFLGRMSPQGSSFYEVYVASWLNPFCLVLGCFTAAIFGLLAAVYLVGEASEGALAALFRRRAVFLAVTVVVLGAVLFAAAEASGVAMTSLFFGNPACCGVFALATLLLVPFWWCLKSKQGTVAVRALGAGMIACVLFGWFALQYPVALRYAGGPPPLTFAEAAAPDATQQSLLGALVVGSCLIFPSLMYLLKVFKGETFRRTG